jgi:alpha-galactosidase
MVGLDTIGASGTTMSISSVAGITTPSAITNWAKLDPEIIGKSSNLLEFSDVGTGDFREPSFRVWNAKDSFSVASLEYHNHHIVSGKPSMPEYMPALYTEAEEEATTLIVEMIDPVSKQRIDLCFTVYHD